ncbi:hypothetical protein BGW80DRAFT_856773 [Lactifluus volemus]|nr:hypothetical protein BGW80DRAFT_856773 [Lactifluus volemus]
MDVYLYHYLETPYRAFQSYVTRWVPSCRKNQLETLSLSAPGHPPWHRYRKPGHHAWIACPPTPSSDPPPFVQGLLSHGNRTLFSNGLQLLSRHGFIADYSDRFRPDAGDNTCCPCNYVDLSSPPPSPGVTHRTTLSHILFSCPLYREQRASTLSHYSSASIFSSEREAAT